MKILIVADGKWGELYDTALHNGFTSLGVESKKFTWHQYFSNSISAKLQNKFLYGPLIDKINKDLFEECQSYKPDLVFIYRGTHIYPNTIKNIKKEIKCKVYGYNNDDPFSKKYTFFDFRLWNLYKKSIPYYDWIFSYRLKNIIDYKNINYKNISLLRSYYIKEKNYFIENTEKKYDIIFIGHFENDNRDETIKYLLDNGIKIQVFGTGWEMSQFFSFFQQNMLDIKPLYGDKYNLTINQAKIALVFLSKLNNDTYTRRCFEIPATKTMMMSEYTDDLNSLFQESKEAEYFKDKEELLEKTKYYLSNERQIQLIGQNGYEKLMYDGHEAVDRCQEILKVFDEN